MHFGTIKGKPLSTHKKLHLDYYHFRTQESGRTVKMELKFTLTSEVVKPP
jgi:hypothetical protein